MDAAGLQPARAAEMRSEIPGRPASSRRRRCPAPPPPAARCGARIGRTPS